MLNGLTRSRLFLWRCGASAALLLLAFGLVRGLWYPGAYFDIGGVAGQFLVLAMVALMVGPVLTTFIYKPGKKGLVFDLWALSLLEVGIVFTALAVMYLRQPCFAVFAVDRFEAVSCGEVDLDAIADKRLGSRPGHEPRLVYAEMPEDPEARSRLVEETLLEGKPDIDRRPEFWRSFTDGIVMVNAASQPFGKLLEADEQRAAAASRWLAASGFEMDALTFLPLRGKASDATLILHAETGFPLTTLAIDPW